MNILKRNFSAILITLMATALIQSCSKNNDSITPAPDGQGTVVMEVTDAPSDDANIKGTFVTVTEVRIDGKTFSGFSGKKTIDKYKCNRNTTI